MADKSPVILFTIATDRDDKGKTKNYTVYAGGGQVTVTNERSETVIKNAILGGNGTIYIANELANGHNEWALIPRSLYNRLAGKMTHPGAVQEVVAPKQKGKK